MGSSAASLDDISISYIFKIAELYDLKVKTTIKPKSSIY